MIKTNILKTMAIGAFGLAANAFAQQQAIQPSPAYYPVGGAPYPAAPAAQPYGQPAYYGPPPAQPVYFPPAPSAPSAQPAYYPPPQGGQPVYYVPMQPAMQMAPPPAPIYIEEEEEGYYWFWGEKWPGLALGPRFGTTGIGLELIFGVNPYLNLRGGANYGSLTWDMDLGNSEYDVEVTMVSVPLLVDIQPFGNHFRITGGVFIHLGSGADYETTPTEPTQVGEHTYNPDTIGTLSGKIEVASEFAPYVGIGFGNAVAEDQLLTFSLDLGVIFQSYDVSLTSNGAGMTAKLDTFREDVKKEEALIAEDMENWEILPVLSIGVAWHF